MNYFKYWLYLLLGMITRRIIRRSKVIITDGERILLVRNIRSSRWSLPGGKRESCETAMECLIRELGEEIGIIVAPDAFSPEKLGNYATYYKKKFCLTEMFIYETARFNCRANPREIQDCQWFSLKNPPENTSAPAGRRIAEYRDGKRNYNGEW